MGRTIGIDLGTTNSVVAVVDHGKPRVLDYQGQRLLPSVVGYSADGKWLVGKPARNQYAVRPDQTVRSVKREMGSSKQLELGGQTFTPPEISGMILREIKRIAELALGEAVTDAVITVPAYFSDGQRLATQEAGRIAGLNVKRIINEPTAAALAYILSEVEDKLVLVYDLGGGTFDVSLVELVGGVVEVRASHGDTQLGGDDFDLRLAELLADEFQKQHEIDVRPNRTAWARLLNAAEQAKITLSSLPFATVKEEYLITQNGVPHHFEYEVSREKFQEITQDLLQKTRESIDKVLADGGIDIKEIDHVLLVGGSTRMPAVHDLIENQLKKEPNSTVNPDEVVALGAAVQGAIIDGDPIDAILVDVTPYSLGIETAAYRFSRLMTDVYTILIPRNTTIPVSKADLFYTLYPDQDAVNIKIYQGEHPVASKNTLLGDFMIDGLKAPTVGECAAVTVQFDFDVDGRLTVTARDRTTGQKSNIIVDAPIVHLNEKSLLQAQTRLEEMSYEEYDDEDDENEEERPALSAAVAALIERTEKVVQRGDLDEQTLAKLTALLAHLASTKEQTDAIEEELVDLLYDLEDED